MKFFSLHVVTIDSVMIDSIPFPLMCQNYRSEEFSTNRINHFEGICTVVLQRARITIIYAWHEAREVVIFHGGKNYQNLMDFLSC